MKYTKRLQGFLPLGIILIVIYLILTFTETGSESFCGFGVDSSGKIYVGRFHTIEVYENRELVHTIPSPTNRGWEMTVSQNDEIIIANGSDVYTLKLDGTIVCKEEDYQSETVYKIKKQRELIAHQNYRSIHLQELQLATLASEVQCYGVGIRIQ